MKNTTKVRYTLTTGALVSLAIAGASFVALDHSFKSEHGRRPSHVLGKASTTGTPPSIELISNTTSPTTSAQHTNIVINFTNRGNDQILLAPGMQFTLVTTAGTIVNATAEYTQPDVIVGGPLSPGSSTKLSLDFTIPNSEQATQLVFTENTQTKPIVLGVK